MESVSSDCSEKSTPIAELIRSNALKAPFFKYGEDLYECLKHKNQIAKNSFEYEKGTCTYSTTHQIKSFENSFFRALR